MQYHTGHLYFLGITEFMITGTKKQLTKVNIDGLTVGENNIVPVTSVRNLGSWFDQNLSMIPHINKICKAASFHIYNIRRITSPSMPHIRLFTPLLLAA